jgi:hypothetical protein
MPSGRFRQIKPRDVEDPSVVETQRGHHLIGLLAHRGASGFSLVPRCRRGHTRFVRSLRMPTLRSPHWRAALISLLLLALPAPVLAQAPATAADADADSLKVPRDLLMDALNARIKPLTNFQIPAGTAKWEVRLLRLNDDAFIVDYTIASKPPFQVQAIVCHETLAESKSTRVDATILGPNETADEFYEANLVYAWYPPDLEPPCTVQFMTFSIQNGWVKHDFDNAKRDAYFTTSPERAVRHMANWVGYLAQNRGDRKRAAQFLAAALEHESDELLKLASGSNLEDAVHRLALLEQTLPSTLFDLQLPLTAAQSVQIGRFLQLRLRLRQKLAAFVDNSGALIQRDQALLRRFGVAQ